MYSLILTITFLITILLNIKAYDYIEGSGHTIYDDNSEHSKPPLFSDSLILESDKNVTKYISLFLAASKNASKENKYFASDNNNVSEDSASVRTTSVPLRPLGINVDDPVLFNWEEPGYKPTVPTTTVAPRLEAPGSMCQPYCPSFKLIERPTSTYEVRYYPTTTWISYVTTTENRILAELEGYIKLHNYFYGLNERLEGLNLTVPYLTQFKYAKHPGILKELSDYTISMPLLDEHIIDPPAPLTNEILIDNVESTFVFCEVFEAWFWELTDKSLRNRVGRFMNVLRENGETFLDRYFYLAAYSRPQLFHQTKYELWVYGTFSRSSGEGRGKPYQSSIIKRLPPNKLTLKTRRKLCRGVECSQFDVLKSYNYGIQKRRYYESVFVQTPIDDCQFTTLAVWKGFMPLHLYKHGVNSNMEVLEATRPIGLLHVIESRVDNTENPCPQNMSVAIFLPQRLHNNPPGRGPVGPNVRIERMYNLIVYVKTVGGYLLEPLRVAREVSDFSYHLKQMGLCFKDNEYYVAVYDFIVRYHGRQNEIWIVAENCK